MKQTAPLHYTRRQRRRSFCLGRDRYGCYYQQYNNPMLVKLLLIVVVVFVLTSSKCVDVTTTAPSQYLVLGNIIPNEKNNGDDNVHHDHDHDHHHVTFTDKDDHHNNNNNNSTDNMDMCHDMYMTMYMDGFHWSLLFHPMQSPNVIICLNYFVSTWKIQYPYEFRGCMLYTFLLAILLEALSSIRTICIQYLQQNKVDPRRRNIHQRNERSHPRFPYFIQHVIATMLYALQTVIGYLLMLIAMSYSIELFLSILFGLIVGNGMFVRYNNSSNETLLSDDTYADDDMDNNIDNDIRRERSDGNNRPCVEHEEQLTSIDINDETHSLLPSSSTLRSRAIDGNIRRRG